MWRDVMRVRRVWDDKSDTECEMDGVSQCGGRVRAGRTHQEAEN